MSDAPFDPNAVTRETAAKLILAGVGGIGLAHYVLRGLREMSPEERRQVALVGGATLVAWGIKKYYDLDASLQFLLDAEAEPPATWEEFQDAVAAQARKAGLP